MRIYKTTASTPVHTAPRVKIHMILTSDKVESVETAAELPEAAALAAEDAAPPPAPVLDAIILEWTARLLLASRALA